MSVLLRTGYDFARAIRITSNGTNENLTGATIKASLKNAAKTTELITDTAQSSGATGADWSTGLVVITFTAASTAALTAGTAWIEISIVLSGTRLPTNDIAVDIQTGYTLS